MSAPAHSNPGDFTSAGKIFHKRESGHASVIVHVVTQLCFGGAENHVAQLAAAQVADGHKVTVIGLWPGKVFPERFLEGLRGSGVECAIVHPSNGILRSSAIVRLGGKLARKDPDVVHSHLPAATIATGWWHHRNNQHLHTKFVATIHGWENRHSHGWRRRLISWGLRHQDQVIAVSHWLARQSVDFGLSPRDVHVVHHGIQHPTVDPAIRQAVRKSIKEHFRIPNAQVIGVIARHTQKKGLEVLIGAIPVMDPRCVVVIIGAEADSTKALKSLVVELGVTERCWFAGTTSNPAEWTAAFDVFCLPSHLEGFGLVFLEAGIIGVPVVGTDVPASNEIIRTGVDGILVPDGDSASLAAAINQTLSNPALARQHVNDFRTRVETEFSFRGMVEAIYKAYSTKSTRTT